MSSDQHVDEIVTLHKKALEAQRVMRDAAAERDEAVSAALKAGASAKGIAEALGLDRQRIYQMAKSAR